MTWSGGPRIPAKPFVDWLHRELARLSKDETIVHIGQASGDRPINRALADRLGITARRLNNYLRSCDGSGRPTESFFQERIEDLLEHAGLRLWDVYDDLSFDDIVLEPDAYCEKCRDIVTPIRGECPWCDTTIGQGGLRAA